MELNALEYVLYCVAPDNPQSKASGFKLIILRAQQKRPKEEKKDTSISTLYYPFLLVREDKVSWVQGFLPHVFHF